MIKKADIFLFIIIVIVGLFASYLSICGSINGDTVKITVGGELYGSYSLDTDREIVINENHHTNNITIKDGTVSMTYSSCKNQVCVNEGAISKTKDKIVCLPNKVVIEICSKGSGSGGDVDVISK